MNEIERIIKKKILPENFFEEEIICDYKITKKQKEIWAIELDLLYEFDSFCKKHNLKYFLAFGSLLGAIRHHGFIPWDDDIDVVMFRNDYVKMLNYIDEFEYPYFFQTEQTDKAYAYSFYKLRNSNTSAVCYKFMYSNMNEGLFLDIFPLDNYVINDDNEKSAKKIKQLNYDNSTIMRMNNPKLNFIDKERVNEYILRSNKSIIENINEINKIATQYNNLDTDLCSVTINSFIDYRKNIFKKEWFDIEYIDLYGHQICIPKNYDAVLKTIYNDYMQLPEISKRVTIHKDAYFDSNNSYIKTKIKLKEKN